MLSTSGVAQAAAVKNGDLVFVSNGAAIAIQAPGAGTYNRVIDGNAPKYSPDGKRVAFVGVFEAGIFELTLTTGKQRRITDRAVRDLAYSPDGKKLVVSVGSGLDIVDVANGATTRIYTSPDSEVAEPAWSPDGTRIAFRAGSVIRLIHPDGSALRTFTRGGSINSDPDWSPDSKTIAFVTNRYNPDLSKTELVTLPRSGKGEPFRVSHRAYPQGLFYIGVAWSPDGKKIAALQFNANHLPNDEDTDERFKVRAYLPDGSHSYSLTGPIVGDDGPEGLDWAPKR
jgi:Tol biopolymer transport system component